MPGPLTIEAVAGLSPNWELTVESSVGVYEGDHVLASLDGSPGESGVYRVVSIPDGDTVNVADDLESPAYGRPDTGEGTFYTPTRSLGLSQIPVDGLHWDAPWRRDMLVADREIRASTLLVDPTSLTFSEINVYKRFVISASTSFTSGTVTGTGAEPLDLSSDANWGLRVITEEATYDLPIARSDFTVPSAVSAADLVTALNTARIGVGADTKIVFAVSGTNIKVSRILDGFSPYVQVNPFPGPAADLNTLTLFDTSVHHGTSGVSFSVPAPQDVSRVGMELVIINKKSSIGPIRYTLQGQSGTTELPINDKRSYFWDGAAWV
jgi:hypothetical protein